MIETLAKCCVLKRLEPRGGTTGVKEGRKKNRKETDLFFLFMKIFELGRENLKLSNKSSF